MNANKLFTHMRWLFLFSLVLSIFVAGCASTQKRQNPLIIMMIKLPPRRGIMAVDDAFIAKTAEWREYIEGLENVSWERIVPSGNYVLYYLDGQPTKMTHDPDKSGKPGVIQYYRNGFVYILISDFDADGLPDVRQYCSGGKAKYVEMSPDDDGQFRIWW